jgi:hypothetical protein
LRSIIRQNPLAEVRFSALQENSMPGYTLIEQNTLTPSKPNGIAPYPNEIGVLDFLRELAADEFPFPQFSELRVLGLEQVLYASRPDDRARALEIRHRLKRAAQDLENRKIAIQIIFEGELKHGDSLWSEYRGQRLPIGHIFSSPSPHTDARGNRTFSVNFNLS